MLREYWSVPTVVFDVVLPEQDSHLVCPDMFRKLGVFEMAEVDEDFKMNRSSVVLRLLNNF